MASEKVGRVRTCQLRPEALEEVERWISKRRTMWERRLDRLDCYLHAHEHDCPDPDQRGEA